MHKLSSPLGGTFHHHRSHQPVNILTPVGRRTRSTKSLERGASTSILPVE
jgi:hypothetical protein